MQESELLQQEPQLSPGKAQQKPQNHQLTLCSMCQSIDNRKENWIGSAATSKDYVENEDILCGVQKVYFRLQRRVHVNKDQYENFRKIGIIWS